MTRQEHSDAVIAAHMRYAAALRAKDEILAHLAAVTAELESAEGELRALARRQPK